MKIHASTLRRKGDIREDDGVGHLSLTADEDGDRELITAIYRVLGPDTQEDQRKGVAWMREFLKSFEVRGERQ